MRMERKYRNISTGAISNDILQVAGSSLAVDMSWLPAGNYERGTPFAEVEVVPAEEACDLGPLTDVYPDAPRVEPPDASRLSEMFEDYALQNWDPSKTNVLYHSSGWDSRIVGTIVRRAREKLGGRLVVVCMSPEWETSRPIIEYQQFHRTAEVYYYDRFSDQPVDFDTLCRHVSGPTDHPLNVYASALRWVREKASITNDVALWCGLFFNETYMHANLLEFLGRWYSSRVAKILSPVGATWNLPALSTNAVRYLYTHANKGEMFRVEVAKSIDPGLAAFDRRGHPESILLSKEQFSAAVREYNNSWYGQTLGRAAVSPTREMHPGCADHREWWGRWTTAAFVEKAVRTGVEVRAQ